jgi:phenylalanyl-tRNA synthetase beta chain
LKHVSNKKTYKPLSKYPPNIEDLAIIAPANVLIGDIINLIEKQSDLIREVSLLDKYEDTKTFHIVYQSYQKNLTSEEVGDIREKILKVLKEKLNARLKE